MTLLNVRRIASGPVADVFTEENLRLCYGAPLAFLGRNGRADSLAGAGEPAPEPGRGTALPET